jgi:hypothetical protein
MIEDTKQVDAPMNGPEATTAPQEGADLTITDLSNIKQIIDLASSRGAFRPGEMVAVGTVYNKLQNFLSSIPKPPTSGV